MDDERRQALERLYSELSPEERRHRIILEPAFRDAYNEIVEADRQFPVPTYLWEKWVPAIGVFPVAVYLELRRMCFVNRATGERRDWCWPRQETIAQRLGVKKRQTVGEALKLLEAHGFIRREKSYRKRGGEGLMQRASDRYLVFFEIPLIEADAVELLSRRISPTGREGGVLADRSPLANGSLPGASPTGPNNDTSAKRTNQPQGDMSAKRTDLGQPVDNPPDRSDFRTEAAGRFSDSRTITRTITKNVNNVIDDNHLEPDQDHSTGKQPVPRRSSSELARIDRVAFEVGETLKAMEGNRGSEDHRSRRFHLLLASRLPENLLRMALAATRDAVEAQRSGRGGVRSDPGAYFAGIARNLAAEQGLEFPLKRAAAQGPKEGVDPVATAGTQRAQGSSASPTTAPRRFATASSGAVPGDRRGDTPMEPEAARLAIQQLLASLKGD